jgi:hypothetical protein
VILGNGEHALAFLLGIPTFLLHQGLFTTRQLQSGEIFRLLLQRFHGHDVSSYSCYILWLKYATGTVAPAGLRAATPRPMARGWGLDGCADERWRARRLLLPFHFGKPASDMGMSRLKLSSLVKGGNCFVKLPRCQACIPVRKGVER